jgi:hypothetical protein
MADALNAARNPERRVSVWRPLELSLDDFAPDTGSPNGYIARVQTRGVVTEPHLVEGSFHLDTFRADGKPAAREASYVFSADRRNQWYLRDAEDAVADNLWDIFIDRATSVTHSGPVEIALPAPRFLVFDGIRLGLRRATFEIELRKQEFVIEVDMRKHAIAYENVLTGQVSMVPLPRAGRLELMRNAEESTDAGA